MLIVPITINTWGLTVFSKAWHYDCVNTQKNSIIRFRKNKYAFVNTNFFNSGGCALLIFAV